MHAVSITCPSCLQEFEVPTPAAQEVPCDVDYDCEICCRPMRIYFVDEDGGEITGQAYGLGAAGVFG